MLIYIFASLTLHFSANKRQGGYVYPAFVCSLLAEILSNENFCYQKLYVGHLRLSVCSRPTSHNSTAIIIILLPRFMECRRGLAMRIILSVRPFVKRVHCDKTEERSVPIFTPYIRSFSLVFWEEEWLVGGDYFYLQFWVNRPPLSPILNRLSRNTKRKFIKTNRKSTTRFPMSLIWSSYVAPKTFKWGSKTQYGCLPCKIALRLKKVCYEVSLCENCQR